MTRRRLLPLLLAFGVLLGLLPATTPQPAGAQAERCFAATSHCIEGRFLDYWQANGGLAVNGYPLSAERHEVLEDGNTYTVQYFERARLEHHPGNAPPYDVLLGQFGRRALRTIDRLDEEYVTRPHTPRDGAIFFPETEHNVSPHFYEYWLQNGGLARFGYPITDEIGVQLEDGKTRGVQYFERARFEYHGENAYPYDVLLGQLGRAILADADLLAGEPGFNLLYLTEPRLQRLIGRPTAPAARGPGAYQAFERGALIWRGDTRQLIMLCEGDRRAGQDVRLYDDTWDEDQPVGGGPGPRPGLHEPSRGFGKLWRERQEVRDCLGYAIEPGETAFTVAVQQFREDRIPHLLISAATPEGRFIYATYRTYYGGSSCERRPSLCRSDYERRPYPAR